MHAFSIAPIAYSRPWLISCNLFRCKLEECKYRYLADQVPPHTGLSPRQGRHTATCPTAPDPASLLGRALMLSRIPRLWILPPCSGVLRHCHGSRGSDYCLPVWEGSDAAMCPTDPDPASCSGGLQCCHVSHGIIPHLPAQEGSNAATCLCSSLWAADLNNNERLRWPTYAARLMCFQGMPTRYRNA
jgi:hypothetical protein